MKEQLERDIELLDEASECVKAVSSFHDREDLKKFVSILQCIIYEITPRDTKEQREVSIWDVIKECEGVTDASKLIKTLGSYEINLSNKYNRYSDEWFDLVEHKEILSDPISFVYRGYQLRLKDSK